MCERHTKRPGARYGSEKRVGVCEKATQNSVTEVKEHVSILEQAA